MLSASSLAVMESNGIEGSEDKGSSDLTEQTIKKRAARKAAMESFTVRKSDARLQVMSTG